LIITSIIADIMDLENNLRTDHCGISWTV